MNNLQKTIRVAVGIATFWFAYWFIVHNQLVVEFFRPQVESGRLGAASANVLTSIVEILAAIGGVVIVIVTRVLGYLARTIESYVKPLVDGSTSVVPNNAVESDPKRLTDDLSRLLIQAVIEGNRQLTIQLAHRLSKKEFLDRPNEGKS